MSFVALAGGIARAEEDGSLAVLEAACGLAEHLAAGGRLSDLEGLSVRARIDPGEAVLAPITLPGAAVYGIGLNYRSKQLATGRELPAQPTLFVKSPAARAAPGAPIVLPPSAPDCVDYEGEIAVVLTRALRDASPASAAGAAGAVAAANDVTARDVLRATGNPSLAKSFPGFGQLGSAVLDPARHGGVAALPLVTRVNGEIRQTDLGAGMLIGVAELLALLSRYVQLRPGDVVLTGTPAGTGDETGSYLVAGDEVEVSVGGLPALSSRVTASLDTATVEAATTD